MAILLLLSYYFYVADKHPVTENTPGINTEPKLSTVEVNKERHELAKTQTQTPENSASSSVIVLKASSTSESKVNPKINKEEGYDEHEIGFSSLGTEESDGLESLTKVSSEEKSDGTTVTSYRSDNSKITINRVEKDQTKVHRVLEGVIFQMNHDYSEITINLKNDPRVAILYLDDNSRVTINGKSMSPSDLKERDEVRADGFGLEGTSNIEVITLEVTGFQKRRVPGG